MASAGGVDDGGGLTFAVPGAVAVSKLREAADNPYSDANALQWYRRVRVQLGGMRKSGVRGKNLHDREVLASLDSKDPVVTVFDFFYATRNLQYKRLTEMMERAESADDEGAAKRLRKFATVVNAQGATAIHVLLETALGLTERGEMDDDTLEHIHGTLEALIDFGCEVTCRDRVHGRTPLHIACQCVLPDVLVTLLDAGANPNVTDRYGYTPLHLLCESKYHVDADISGPMIKRLLKAGADLRETAASKSPVFMLAEQILLSIFFHQNQKSLTFVDYEHLEAVYFMLEVLINWDRRMTVSSMMEEGADDQADDAGESSLGATETSHLASQTGSGDDEENDALQNAFATTGHSINLDSTHEVDSTISLHRLKGVEMSPLGMVLVCTIVLLELRSDDKHNLVKSEGFDIAIRSCQRCCRLLLDHGASLEEPCTYKIFKAGGEKLSNRGTILDLIVRHQVALLVMHPRVQRELNSRWGPRFAFDFLTLPNLLWINKDEDFNKDAQELEENQLLMQADRSEITATSKVKIRHYNLLDVMKANHGTTRQRFVLSSLAYLLFCIMLTVVLVSIEKSSSTRNFEGAPGSRVDYDYYLFSDSVDQRLPGVGPDESGFDEVNSVDGIWDYLNGPVLELSDNNNNPMLRDKLIAPIRLRQFRAFNDSALPDWTREAGWNRGNIPIAETFSDKCVSRFESESPFDDDHLGLSYTEPEAYPYRHQETAIWGMHVYTSGGYQVALAKQEADSFPPLAVLKSTTNITTYDNATELSTADVLAILKALNWIDAQTSYVSVDFGLYHSSIDRFAVGRYAFEMPIAGAVKPDRSRDVVRLSYYTESYDVFVAILGIAIVVGATISLIAHIVAFVMDRYSWVKDLFNVLDLIIIALIYTLFFVHVSNVRHVLDVQDFMEKTAKPQVFAVPNGTAFSAKVLLEQAGMVDQLGAVSLWNRGERNLAAILLIVAWMGVIKYARAHPDVGILVRIINKELQDLSIFLFVYLALLFGFAVGFYMSLSDEYEEFSILTTSITTLFLISVGDFNYYNFTERGFYLAAFLWIVYMVLSLILLLNLLIAMLSQSYSNVYEVASFEYICEQARLVLTYQEKFSWTNLLRQAAKCCRRSGTIAPLDDIMLAETGKTARAGSAYGTNELGIASAMSASASQTPIYSAKNELAHIMALTELTESSRFTVETFLDENGQNIGVFEHIQNITQKFRVSYPKVTSTPLKVPLMRAADFIFSKTGKVKTRPDTVNEPYASVVVDLGVDRKLMATSCKMTADPFGCNAWVLQGTNDINVARKAVTSSQVGTHRMSELDGDTVQAALDQLASRVNEPKWTTLFVNEGSKPSLDAKGKVISLRQRRDFWTGLRSLVENKLDDKKLAKGKIPGAFRFFRIMAIGPHWPATKKKYDDGRSRLSLSFAGLEMFGALIRGYNQKKKKSPAMKRKAAQEESNAAGVEFDGAAVLLFSDEDDGDEDDDDDDEDEDEGGEDDDDDEEESFHKLDVLARQVKLLGKSEATMFAAILAAVEHNSEQVQRSFQKRMDHQISVLTRRQRMLQKDLEYVVDHIDVGEQDYVYESAMKTS